MPAAASPDPKIGEADAGVAPEQLFGSDRDTSGRSCRCWQLAANSHEYRADPLPPLRTIGMGKSSRSSHS
jgi:hypothetical protein